jgi:dipeptidyl aminopeptidase/acylaminoacyl peptidase
MRLIPPRWQAVPPRVRRMLLCLCVLALIVSNPAAGQQDSAKRPLTHNDYDSWKTISGQMLTPDGKFLVYTISAAAGEGEMVVRNLETGAEWRRPRGGKGSLGGLPTKTGKALPPEILERLGGGGQTGFTSDSKRLLYLVTPSKADFAKFKETKNADDLPKTGLGVMDLASGKTNTIPQVKSFRTNEESASLILYQRGTKADPAATKKADDGGTTKGKFGKGKGTTEPPPKAKGPVYGSDLVIRNLDDDSERVIPDVLEFSWSKDAKTLVYSVSAKDEAKNGLYAVTPGSDEAPIALLAGKGRYTRLSWDEKQTQLVFLATRDDVSMEQPRYSLYVWDRHAPAPQVRNMDEGDLVFVVCGLVNSPTALTRVVGAASVARLQRLPPPRAIELLSSTSPKFSKGMMISATSGLSFTEDGSKLFLSLAPIPDKAKEAKDGKDAKKGGTDDKVVVDIWHWKDDYIPPLAKKRGALDNIRSFQAVLHLREKKLVQLGDQTVSGGTASRDGRLVMGSDDRPYRSLVGYEANYKDYYVISTADGVRRPLMKKHEGLPSWSYKGNYVLAYDGKDWKTRSLTDGKTANLTKKIGVSFASEDFDSPSTIPSYGVMGWTSDDQYVFLYDKYDIWQVAADGSDAKNLTGGFGREKKIQFRHLPLDPKARGIDPSKPLLLRAENLRNRDQGFYLTSVDGQPPARLAMSAKNFSYPVKAKNADVILVSCNTFYDYPDWYITKSDFKQFKKVSNVGAQRDPYVWGKSELVHFKNSDGVPLSGMLIKPENFDPTKKYPLMVYIYERLSQNVHNFVHPRAGTSINASYYASNGYLVFMPDIVYKVGYPGQSSLKCVLPGIQAVVDKGYVDEKAIGIQGHSWGGYQIAYMITQTNRFKAVSAGAPVSNMTSAYSAIRWGTGLPRQFQYERTQSRIGGTLWQFPMRFVENSPVFMADRVQTPVIMLHNDQDGAVPWYQGIEFFLALRRLGKEAYMFNYIGEDHGLIKKQNQRDYTVRMQQFFDHHLRGAPRPDWMERGSRPPVTASPITEDEDDG